MAAIIATHRTRNDPNDPKRVATPMSIPFICRTATIQAAAANPSVVTRALVIAAVP
jgi:hypothetical protein